MFKKANDIVSLRGLGVVFKSFSLRIHLFLGLLKVSKFRGTALRVLV